MKPRNARPGRPRAFDEDAALEAAMNVFWQKGYDGASIADFFAVCMDAANLSVARATARAGTDKFKG